MKLIRFQKKKQIHYGILDNDEVTLVDNFNSMKVSNEPKLKAEEINILLPVNPSKILCVGLNYKTHAEEVNLSILKEPVIFMKPRTSLIKSRENIIYPKVSSRVDYEGELAVVIKKTGKNITKDNVKDYILGYICVNDVTARDLQPLDGQWIIAKGFDTFLPCSQWIETEVDINKATVTTLLNGEIKQKASCSDMIFSVEDIIIYCSNYMTLEEGDIILTGTPSGIGSMNVGDVVQVIIDGVGSCVNKIVAE